jgi:hypothetical protein
MADLERVGIVARIGDAIAFATESQVLLLRHTETGVNIDASVAWLPFELEAIAAATPAKVGPARLQVAQAEDLIIYKSVAWRPQDQQDVERLLVLHGARIDLARVRRHVRDLGDAMEQDRIHGLDAVIRRVLRS